MEKIKIGELENGVPVMISESSPNQHIAIFGMSGTGKSTRIMDIEKSAIRSGYTVIAFDLDGKAYADGEKLNRINAISDGIEMYLLNDQFMESKGKSYVNFVASVTQIIAGTEQFGVRQIGALREAIEFAIENKGKFTSEMEAIAEGLNLQSTHIAKGVYNKLWTLLNCGVFRKSSKKLVAGEINVIDLQGIESNTQRAIVEIMLGTMWRQVRLGNVENQRVMLVIDEFQNLNLKKGSVLMEMLRESRKFGINLVLATQSVKMLPSNVFYAIQQTAVQLYFRPGVSEIREVAEAIDSMNREHWLITLRNLCVGESVATGNLKIKENEIRKPLVIHSTGAKYNKYMRKMMYIEQRK